MRTLLFSGLAIILCSYVFVIIEACSATKPGGVLYVDPKEFPCGINGNYCNPGHPLPCCYENNTCGGPKYDPTCAENECCFIGNSLQSRRLEDSGSLRRGTPMRTQ